MVEGNDKIAGELGMIHLGWNGNTPWMEDHNTIMVGTEMTTYLKKWATKHMEARNDSITGANQSDIIDGGPNDTLKGSGVMIRSREKTVATTSREERK